MDFCNFAIHSDLLRTKIWLMKDLDKIIENGDELALIGWIIGMILVRYLEKLLSK
jgi:hypothetical protein